MFKPVAVTLVAAGLAATLFGGGAAGAQDSARTIELTAVAQHCGGADNGRRGDSFGDLDFCRGVLREVGSGAAAGRVRWTCLYLGSTRAGSDCTAVVRLPGGVLLAAGPLSHIRATSAWAITGGTGSYAGARGTVRLKQLSETRTATAITLLP